MDLEKSYWMGIMEKENWKEQKRKTIAQKGKLERAEKESESPKRKVKSQKGDFSERIGPVRLDFARDQRLTQAIGVIGAADKNSHGPPQKGRMVRPFQQKPPGSRHGT